VAIGVSAVIGAYHAGVEYQWWQGLTACTSTATTGGNPLDAIMHAPLVRCDVAQWTLFRISLAGWNFLISSSAALAIAVLLAHSPRVAVA
jgi:disulfide bond formation protein DsbB